MNRDDRIRFQNLADAWRERGNAAMEVARKERTPMAKMVTQRKGTVYLSCAEELQVLIDHSKRK